MLWQLLLCVCVWWSYHSQKHHATDWNCISRYFDCRIGDEDKSWAPNIISTIVTWTWEIRLMLKVVQCPLQCPWFGKNPQLIQQTVISVWYHLFRKEYLKKREHNLYEHSLSHLTCSKSRKSTYSGSTKRVFNWTVMKKQVMPW